MSEYVLMHKELGRLYVGIPIGEGTRYFLGGETPLWSYGPFGPFEHTEYKHEKVWIVYDSEYHGVYLPEPTVKVLFENLGEL